MLKFLETAADGNVKTEVFRNYCQRERLFIFPDLTMNR